MTGRVKNLNEDKFYCFITGDDGKDYFCHVSAMVNKEDWNSMEKGTTVEFEPGEGLKGPKAEMVILA